MSPPMSQRAVPKPTSTAATTIPATVITITTPSLSTPLTSTTSSPIQQTSTTNVTVTDKAVIAKINDSIDRSTLASNISSYTIPHLGQRIAEGQAAANFAADIPIVTSMSKKPPAPTPINMRTARQDLNSLKEIFNEIDAQRCADHADVEKRMAGMSDSFKRRIDNMKAYTEGSMKQLHNEIINLSHTISNVFVCGLDGTNMPNRAQGNNREQEIYDAGTRGGDTETRLAAQYNLQRMNNHNGLPERNNRALDSDELWGNTGRANI